MGWVAEKGGKEKRKDCLTGGVTEKGGKEKSCERGGETRKKENGEVEV